MKIFISGSLAFDRIMNFPGRFKDHILPDKIKVLNVCFVGDTLTERFGGTAGNIAYSLALLGEKPLVLSSAGKDFTLYKKRLQNLGLALHGICNIENQLTANCHITTDMDDNQITCFSPAAMGTPCGYTFTDVSPAQDIAIVAPGNLEDMITLPEKYKTMGMRYIFDPGQNITALAPDDIAKSIAGAFALISNDYELEMILRATNLTKESILNQTTYLITTLGDKGSVVCSKGTDPLKVKAVPANKVVDPTGAGDAYRAGLLKGLALGKPLPQAAQVGATCATWCVEKLGTQEHSFSTDDFWTLYKKHFG